jgi:integrase
LKVALHRKRLLELLSKEDFMFTLEMGDYKFIFEYDTPEELEKYLKLTMATHEQAEEIRNRHNITHKIIEKEEQYPKNVNLGISFFDLETKFLVSKKKLNKVSESSYKAYASTFGKLKDFFDKTKINTITIEDFERFRDFLADEYDLVNKTINNHMKYVNLFLEYGVNYKLINENNVKGIEHLKEDSPLKENYTDADIQKIFSYDYPQNYKDIFKIGAYTGMRVSEIINLSRENIKIGENEIYYFDILKSKTKAGVRKVPIHKDILDDVLKMDFPLLKEKTNNAAQKAILKQLYKVIDKDSTKSFHTFRGTFVSKCQNEFPQLLVVIQEIVGHSKGQFKMTSDDYGKGFPLHLKQNIVDTVSFL